MAWTLCTSGAAILKAGNKCNSTINTSGAALQQFSDMAEGSICSQTRKDWITDYASVKASFKPILADLCSDMIAVKMINWDTDSFSSTRKAELALDILTDNINKNLNTLRSEPNKEVM